MNRRKFFGLGLVGAAEFGLRGKKELGSTARLKPSPAPPLLPPKDIRKMFPRLERDVFLNAAGGIPQSTFSMDAVNQFETFWRLGPGDGRRELQTQTHRETRELFAKLIGAEADEIAFVQNTKAGEQTILDGIPAIRSGGNIVTNDLHFGGSLHNLLGMRKSGVDVRIVKSKEWTSDLNSMKSAIDNETQLVCISLVSNINGHVEQVRELAEHAHKVGAKVYADIIQAAGIYPLDVRELQIDFAACSGYKWLFGSHGAGFLFVAREHQGGFLQDRVFPGHTRHQYDPWVDDPSQYESEFTFASPTNARRYETGHVSYLGFSILNAGLKFIHSIGIKTLNEHSVKLIDRLKEKVDAKRYPCISPKGSNSPIVTFLVDDSLTLAENLIRNEISVGVSRNRLRVSPAIYNNEDDIDRLVLVLNSK